MFESWHDRNDEQTRFWLQFQVLSDGLEYDACSSPSSSSFTCFSHLPPEIRLKIWECLIRPRVVIAVCSGTRFHERKAAQLALRPRGRAVPVLLHVCHEARQLALRHYELAFAWKIPYRLSAAAAAAVAGSGTAPPPSDRGEARVWFNFDLDALFLLGELEPFDPYGFNSPMVYFLLKDDTRRVKHVACAFEELQLGVYESEQIFGCLFHIVDRFPAAKRLLITSTPKDLELGHLALPSQDNVIQKLWRGWINGTSIVTSSLADTQMLMIAENDLASFIAEHG